MACQAEADFEEDVPPSPGPSELPNIIFILADDLDTRSVSHMPGLESLLVEEGTTFVNALATASPMPALDHQACAVSARQRLRFP